VREEERKAIADRLREILAEAAEASKNAHPDYWAVYELDALKARAEELAIKIEAGTFPWEEGEK